MSIQVTITLNTDEMKTGKTLEKGDNKGSCYLDGLKVADVKVTGVPSGYAFYGEGIKSPYFGFYFHSVKEESKPVSNNANKALADENADLKARLARLEAFVNGNQPASQPVFNPPSFSSDTTSKVSSYEEILTKWGFDSISDDNRQKALDFIKSCASADTDIKHVREGLEQLPELKAGINAVTKQRGGPNILKGQWNQIKQALK